MDKPTCSFVQEHNDFVLKLKISAADGTSQIRRVRLPKIADGKGSVSYEELIGLVVVFTFPDGSPENYSVSLTYFDVDKDAVTIACADELVDAIDQFSDKKMLRIATEVKVNNPEANPEEGTADAVTPGARVDRGTSTTVDKPALIAPQVQKVLETFVGALTTAVTTLQDGAGSSSMAKRAGPDVTPAANTPSADEPQEEAKKSPPAFIHGRHTCDSCLVTPIVGKRYHAKNLPDYDLCQGCHGNYTGSDIQFESVELDRDRAFQTRWNRRHEKMSRLQERKQVRAARAGRRCGRGPAGRRASMNIRLSAPPPPHGMPPPPHGMPPPPVEGMPPPPVEGMPPPPVEGMPPPPVEGMPPPPHGMPSPPHGAHPAPHGIHWAHIAPHVLPHVPPHVAGGDFEDALTEAIRRSLQDCGPTDSENAKAVPSAPLEETADEENQASATEAESQADDSSLKANSVVSDTPDVDPMFEDATEVDASSETEDAKVPAIESKSITSPKSGHDESFHADAIGMGDVAEAIGATMDMFAGAIDEILTEANSPGLNGKSPVEEVKLACLEVDKILFPAEKVGESEESEAPSEALIVESTVKPDEDSVNSDVSSVQSNDWQVVSADEKTVDVEEDMARATGMLGSALFNSDMNDSQPKDEENMSTLSDSFSVPSNIPSIGGVESEGSAVAPAQLERWSNHLTTLRELGFADEKVCVEVLERLEAANIGVDSADEVSVTQAVNAMLEK